MNQLVIRGGTVIDGTGAAPRRADVAVANGRISEIGTNLDGDRTVDASEHVVAPGFIDIHTHYDAQVFWDPSLTPTCFHGYTTVVAGNCGFGLAPTRPEHRDLIVRTLEKVEDMDGAALDAGIPWDFTTFPEYLASVEEHGLGLNFAVYLGHTPLRLFVMGDDAYDRYSTPAELEAMREVIRTGLAAGALGFATSFAITHRGVDGKPVPSRRADLAEVEGLFAVLHEEARGIAMVTPGDIISQEEVFAFQRRLGVPMTMSALLTSPGGHHRVLSELNSQSWAEGGRMWPQVTPRPLRFAISMAAPYVLNMNSKFAELLAQPDEARREAYGDPTWREAVVEVWRNSPGEPRWSTFAVAESGVHPELIGRSVDELAAERISTPFDLLLDLALEESDFGDLRVFCTLANDDEVEVVGLLLDEHATLGLSDAGAHVGQICDAPQATDYLGNWVRERNLLPLEEAVHRLTGRQADVLGIPDRGRLTLGAWADIVVFDPATVSPGPTRRVADFPSGSERLTADNPVGVRHVLVNGELIREDGLQDLTVRSGQLVRSVPRV